ncbi:hypothetical protein [Paraburkholderia tropica]|uniref:hypothetical protein n=1 Tax=Paraburkholderia tropica TaxID=92647 RepID=UPI000945C2E9|nr:hypothetical protein [Paraburkholderia tropica]RQN33645.1 hypothetical protein EHZ25_38750 [Paraburkholderia tropica]
MIDRETSNERSISPSAIWALQRLAEVREGRDAPALGWSVARELISAGFAGYRSDMGSGIMITAAGQAFLASCK